MFCDLVGSSALSTRRDPEEQADVIAAFHACCAKEIKALGGMVAQYPGDGVLPLFWISGSGVVVVGDLMREGVTQENVAIGETMNLVARLQALAEPNSVAISPATHRYPVELR